MNQPTLKHVQIRAVDFGDNVTIIQPANLYGCKVGNDCFIGPFVEIQKDVIIGDRCKIHSHAFVCEMVTIGNDCIISHGVMFINDPFKMGGPARRNKELWKATHVGSNVSIGTNSTIMPVNICDHVVVGAGSVVTRDITVSGIYAGNPARLIRKL